jgi:acetolactate synthase I/II/III large subunit
MKTSELIVECLEAEGVEYIFGIPGEENIEFLNALSSSEIQFILTRDERWAAFMANAYGRFTGKPGVCLSTLGPGATNLITGVADALLDFAPVIAITGQVGLKKMHKESHQYLDILSAMKPVTKWNTRIEDPDTTPEIIRKAFKISSFEKPGPVHIELPEDVASLEAEGNPIPHDAVRYPEVSEESLLKAASLIQNAKMPLVLAGNGIIRGNATKVFRDFIAKTKIGVTTTFMGMGALPADDECFISTVGLQSRDYISCGFDRTDLVIAIGYDPVEFAPHLWNHDVLKNIIHVGFSPSETDAHYSALELIGDIGTTLSLLSERIDSSRDVSFYRTLKLYADHGLHFSTSGFPLKPLRVINEIRKALGRDDILISDVGAHKLWIARFFPAYGENTVVISNGLASMGFALPAAISAKLLHKDKKVIAVAGDGGFLMAMCELNTAVRLGLNFVCLIFNDGGYGLIEWKEKLRYKKDFFVKFHNPDFVKLAESFGAKGYRISSAEDLFPVLQESLRQNHPVIIDCPVDYSENLKLTEKLGKLICPL